MRPLHITLVVIALLWFHTSANSGSNHCRITRTATGETVAVDWWVLLTSGSGSRSPHQLWYKEGNNDVAHELLDSQKLVQQLIESHNLHDELNAEAIREADCLLGVKTGQRVVYRFLSEIPKVDKPPGAKENIYDKINVLQFWVNDQPTKGKNKPEGQYRFAHGKWLLSLGKDGENNFFLQHSFPKIPNEVEDRYYHIPQPGSGIAHHCTPEQTQALEAKSTLNSGERYKEPASAAYTFWSPPNENRFVKSQHAICINVKGKEKAEELIAGLAFTYPNLKAVIPQVLLPEILPFSNLKLLYNIRPNTECHNEHRSKLPPQRNERMDKCTKTMKHTDFSFIFHSPLPHNRKEYAIKNQSTDQETTPQTPTSAEARFDYKKYYNIGPVPWAVVANYIESPLDVLCWKNQNFPTARNDLQFSRNPVRLVESHSRDGADWSNGQMHEKIGVAPEGSHNPWVCFGDSNHRPSEVSHAGVMVCFQNGELHKFFSTGLKLQDPVEPELIPSRESYSRQHSPEAHLPDSPRRRVRSKLESMELDE